MLYFSRYEEGGYVIVDSDDNVETVVGVDDLDDIVNAGLEIKGVETRGRCPNKTVVSVYPYVRRNDKVKTTKMLMHFGVDIVVNGEVVSALKVGGNKTDPPVTIRLSDVAKGLDSWAFGRLPKKHRPLVLILDDKLVFHGYEFRDWFKYGVTLDIREITREKNAKKIYDIFFDTESDNRNDPQLLRKYLLDDFNRMSGYMALGYVCNGYGSISDQRVRYSIPNFAFASDFVSKSLLKTFESLANHPFRMLNRSYTFEFDRYIEEYGDKKSEDMVWLSDFNRLSKAGHLMFNTAPYCFTCRPEQVRRLYVVVQYYDASKEVLSALVKFCNRAHDFLVSQRNK